MYLLKLSYFQSCFLSVNLNIFCYNFDTYLFLKLSGVAWQKSKISQSILNIIFADEIINILKIKVQEPMTGKFTSPDTQKRLILNSNGKIGKVIPIKLPVKQLTNRKGKIFLSFRLYTIMSYGPFLLLLYFP